ncbi:unnamed protein product [Oikopleura dioica]|uniref:Transcription factor CBF/NF-Y/archaeal histone domain-containing protein n=1 Tax=Oikopleura dioica TaxID=34765 RepID=E4YDF5_OIKDI|nr:unnamed protein product [Oikopleura dioica]
MSESDNSDYEPLPDDELEENDTPPDGGEAAILADIWGSGSEEKKKVDEDKTGPPQVGRDLFSPTTEATADLELMRLKSTGEVNEDDNETGDGEEQEVEEDEEQNTPEEVDAQNGDSNGEPHAKRPRQALTRLPLSRIKTMLKNFDPEWKGQSADAAVALILAGEQFIESLARQSFKIAETGRRKTVKKDDVKFVFQTEEEYSFLDGCFDSKTGCL